MEIEQFDSDLEEFSDILVDLIDDSEEYLVTPDFVGEVVYSFYTQQIEKLGPREPYLAMLLAANMVTCGSAAAEMAKEREGLFVPKHVKTVRKTFHMIILATTQVYKENRSFLNPLSS